MSDRMERFTDWNERRATDITHPVQCTACRHYRDDATCDAFPDGIPVRILENDHDHRRPYPGDHGVRFDPVDAAAARLVAALFDPDA